MNPGKPVASLCPERVLHEPLWRLETELSPLERELLASQPLRRLRFLCHNGASALTTPLSFSRLEHTLGVFSLVAYFAPEDADLRAAALLHDIGHAPFSHTLEQLSGVDHHRWTQGKISASPIAEILQRHGRDPERVWAVVAGEEDNLLKNRCGILHCDHLDSWMRSGQALGLLPTVPSELLSRLDRRGSYLETDLAAAEELARLIVAGAGFHASPQNLGPDAVLGQLVGRLMAAGALSPEELALMTDDELTARLFALPDTVEEARALWHEPWRLRVTRQEDGTPSPQGYLIRVTRLYLAMPLVGGKPVTEHSEAVREWLVGAEALLGDYLVSWG